MKRFLAGLVCAVTLLVGSPAQAEPILIPQTDTVFGTVFFDLALTPTVLGLSGSAVADVFEGAVAFQTGLFVVDDTDPFPVSLALYTDLVDDALVFDFDFGGSVFDFAGGNWALPVIGGALVLTDPGLAPFVGTNLGFFSLFGEPTVLFEGDLAIGVLANYSLKFIAAPDAVSEVPEPATMTLIGTGLVLAARRRRSQRAHQA